MTVEELVELFGSGSQMIKIYELFPRYDARKSFTVKRT